MLTKYYIYSLFLVLPIYSNAQKIYKSNNISESTIKVYITSNLEKADLIVKEIKDSSEINSDGLWLYVPINNADFVIYFVSKEKESDINIYFTQESNLVGWKNKNKVTYLKRKK